MKKYLAFIVMLVLFGMNEAMGQWLTSGSNIYNSNTGNVGIGNSSPTTLLQVAKNMTEPTITVQNLGGIGGATYSMVDNFSGANWKFKATNSGGFKIRDHANSLDVFLIEPNSSANSIYIKSGGNVGIGITNPDQKLYVNGSIGLPGTINSSTGILYKEGSPFLHDFKASSIGSIGQNVFLGKNAGNFTMPGGANYQSSDNTGVGASALSGNTTGFANTSIGSFAMPTNSSGFRNTAIGVYSLYSNLSGIQNTSMGVYSAQYNSSGNNNVTIGFNANCFNQTGSNNTIIGFYAGSGTSVHNKSGNIFIGYLAGYNETGSNKLYIENSNSSSPLIGGDFSLDQLYLNGTIGIGTTTPSASAKLEIVSTDKGFLPPRMTTDQIDAISGPATGLMVYNTTMNKPQYYDGTGWRNFDGTHYIGESFGGGIVFYIDGAGQHGLIASPTDQSGEATWGCWMTFIGATSTGIGSGQANTTAIVNGCGESWIAARICNDLVLNGYDDWFLPSFDELHEMYEQRNVIGASNSWYWCSSEVDLTSAWAILFDGYNIYQVDKGSTTFVRAIRAF